MALAIDTKHLAEHWTSDHERHLDAIAGSTGRFQLYRVFAHAAVIHDDVATIRRLSDARSKPISLAKKALLDLQADQEVDLDEVEVFHHLEQLAATTKVTDPCNTRPLLTWAQCPTFAAKSKGRPASSFRRYSVKISMVRSDKTESNGYYMINHTDLRAVIPGVRSGSWRKWAYEPKIVWANGTGEKQVVVWHLQLDYVDLLSRSTDLRLAKRRRTLNHFHCISEPQRTSFSGVRYRSDRNTWVAEMKPYKGKSKVQFGEFKDKSQAARAVDAAFFHYGKAHLLNFPDSTPHLLAKKRIPLGLNEGEKRKLVKDQAKWLASAQVPSADHTDSGSGSGSDSGCTYFVSSSKPDCTATALELRTFSEITSNSNGSEEADDGISQSQPWMLGDPNYCTSVPETSKSPKIEQHFELEREFIEILSNSPLPTQMCYQKRGSRSSSPGDFVSRLREQKCVGW